MHPQLKQPQLIKLIRQVRAKWPASTFGWIQFQPDEPPVLAIYLPDQRCDFGLVSDGEKVLMISAAARKPLDRVCHSLSDPDCADKLLMAIELGLDFVDPEMAVVPEQPDPVLDAIANGADPE
jgi:hypothetical protein